MSERERSQATLRGPPCTSASRSVLQTAAAALPKASAARGMSPIVHKRQKARKDRPAGLPQAQSGSPEQRLEGVTNTPVLGQTQASAQPAPSGPAQPSLSGDRASTKTASKSGEVTPDHSAISDPCEDANSTNGRKLLTRVLAETPYNLNELAAWAQSKDWFRNMPPEVRMWPVEDLGCLVTKLGGLVSTAPPASVTPMAQTPLAPAVNAQASARVRIPEPARFNGENCTPEVCAAG